MKRQNGQHLRLLSSSILIANSRPTRSSKQKKEPHIAPNIEGITLQPIELSEPADLLVDEKGMPDLDDRSILVGESEAGEVARSFVSFDNTVAHGV